MTSADFCVFSVILRLRLLLSERFTQTSLGTTRFFLSIHLPHLSCMIPCSYWASTCMAVLPSCITSYVISVRQTRDLPVDFLFPHPASFRFHLTMDTLAFGYILPTTGRIQDFHLLETCAARRTITTGAVLQPPLFYSSFINALYFFVEYHHFPFFQVTFAPFGRFTLLRVKPGVWYTSAPINFLFAFKSSLPIFVQK